MSISHVRQSSTSAMSISHVRQSCQTVMNLSVMDPSVMDLSVMDPCLSGLPIFAVCVDRMTDRATSIRKYTLTSRSTNQPTNTRIGRQTYRPTDTERGKQTNVRLTYINRQIDTFYRCYKLTNITDNKPVWDAEQGWRNRGGQGGHGPPKNLSGWAKVCFGPPKI